MTWRTILSVDFDKHAAATYAENFPGVDVRCAKVEDVLPELREGMADVICGGPPCQSFSLAGKGLGESDPRNGWPAFIEAVRIVRPRMFLAENVPGMLTDAHRPYLGRCIDALEKIGYRVELRELDAVNFGVPQFRNRVWLWGIRADVKAKHQWPKPTHAWPWPEPCMFGAALLPAVTVGWALNISHWQADGKWFAGNGPHVRVIGPCHNPAKGELRTKKDITATPSGTIQGPSGNQTPEVHEYRWSDAMLEKHPPASPASPASTIQSKFFKGGAEGLVEVPDDGWRKVRFYAECDPEGDGLCPEHGIDFADFPCIGPTEDDCEYQERDGVLWGRRITTDHGVAVLSEPSSTLKAGGNIGARGKQGGGCPPVLIQRDDKHPVQQAAEPASTITSGGDGHGPTENSLKLSIDGRTWDSRHPVAEPPSPSPSLRARSPRDGGRCTENCVREKLMVRRLTPEECMRLMSAPDDFKWPEKITKTAKYRIAGNGWACAVAAAMSRAFKAADPASETVIDLFAGGGLGACGWHQRFWRYEP